jgi:thioredoxin reductase (NADPH)
MLVRSDERLVHRGGRTRDGDQGVMSDHDLIIVGAGPAGMAAGIAAGQAGFDYVIVEKGVLVNSIFHFPSQMVFFTTADLLEIGGLPFVSPYDKPTRHEVLRYYRRVQDIFGLPIRYAEEVVGITPDDVNAFTVTTRTSDGMVTRRCRAVVLAIGYYDHPNLLGVPGEDLPHVSHYFSETHAYYGRKVVVAGGGNSAAEAALELRRAGANVTLVHYRSALKSTIKYWVKPDIENRIKEGAITAYFDTRIAGMSRRSVCLETKGSTREIDADNVLLLTGYHPDFTLLKAAGVSVNDANGVAQHDPQTFETNVANLFIAGGAITGKNTAPIFIENGRFHGDAIVKVLRERFGPARSS